MFYFDKVIERGSLSCLILLMLDDQKIVNRLLPSDEGSDSSRQKSTVLNRMSSSFVSFLWSRLFEVEVCC